MDTIVNTVEQSEITLFDVFDITELQSLQDIFAELHKVGSIITLPNGTPATQPSNFCSLCKHIIRPSNKGAKNCRKSDATLGRLNPSGPSIRRCINAGLWDASVSITFGNLRLGDWLIGQIRTETYSKQEIYKYAHQLDIDPELFYEAYLKVPIMPLEHFQRISKLLFKLVKNFCDNAYKNHQLKFEKEYNQQRERYYRLLIDNSTDAISILSNEGNIKFISASGEKTLGFQKDELLDCNVFDMIHPDDLEHSRRILNTIKQLPDKVEHFNIHIQKKDKTWVCIDGAVKNMLHVPEINGIVCSYHDATVQIKRERELKRAKQRAEHSRIRFQQLIENLPCGIAIYKPINSGKSFKFIDFNKVAEQITCVKKEELIGLKLLEQFPNMQYKPLHNALTQVAKTGEKIYIPPFHYEDEKQKGWRENHIYQLPSKEVVVIFNDVSELKRAEQDLQYQNELLQAAKTKAEESDRLKSAFLANMSHEIRTPMNGIIGFLELMQDPCLTLEEREDYLQTVIQSGERLLKTINDLIEFSKIEAGDIPVVLSEVRINEVLQSHLSFFSPEAQLKDIHLKLDIPEEETIVTTDKNKLDSILTNLIKNALKFTTAGFIRVGYQCIDGALQFYVKDSGCGIPQLQLSVIFERFRQIETSNPNQKEGSGLGLSICKWYVEKLGGKIWVESHPGLGSTFHFTIKR